MQEISKSENQEKATTGMQSVQMGAKAENISQEKTMYSGKYPNRIMMIYSSDGRMMLKTNAGAVFQVTKLNQSAPLPLVGEEIEHWLNAHRSGVLVSLDAQNDEARALEFTLHF